MNKIKKHNISEDSTASVPIKTFKVKGKEYLVFAKDDDLQVTQDGRIVFDKFKSKLSYIQWVNSINN